MATLDEADTRLNVDRSLSCQNLRVDFGFVPATSYGTSVFSNASDEPRAVHFFNGAFL